jgi:hypothetical protein
MTADLKEFTTRYVQMWNEPDPGLRAAIVDQLWAPTGVNYTQSLEAHGRDAVAARVDNAHETYVQPGTYFFRAAHRAALHHGAIRIDWEMVTSETDAVASTGIEFILLDAAGRIQTDYQFLNP